MFSAPPLQWIKPQEFVCLYHNNRYERSAVSSESPIWQQGWRTTRGNYLRFNARHIKGWPCEDVAIFSKILLSSSFFFRLSCVLILAVFSGVLTWMPPSWFTCYNCFWSEVVLSFYNVAAISGAKDFFFYSLRTCTVHRQDVAWSNLIS